MMKKRIKDLPLSQRPREKLTTTGAQNLTTAELLAILISTGSSKYSALTLAKKLIAGVSLRSTSIKDLCKIGGVGPAKATKILAAVELGRRLFIPATLTKITTDKEALTQVKDLISKKQEHIVALYLNARSELLEQETLAIGSLNTNLIEPKEIFRQAISLPAASIIIIHNHPSGDPKPSEADINFTKTVQTAGDLLGIKLLNHLIVCQTNFFSFADNKVFSIN